MIKRINIENTIIKHMRDVEIYEQCPTAIDEYENLNWIGYHIGNKIVGIGYHILVNNINHIGGLYVIPKYRGQGIFKKLFLELLYKDNTKITRLSIIKPEHKLKEYYTKFGFFQVCEPDIRWITMEKIND